MSQAMQVFAAPGDPDGPLPKIFPAWTFDRTVYLPLWDWYLILDEARKRDEKLGELLTEASGSAEVEQGTDRNLPEPQLATLITFIEQLADEFGLGVDLTAAQEERGLGDYDSTVYAEMLRAMAEVLQEAQRMRQPFQSWAE